MKVQLRRVHIRIDVTTERGERRDVTISHRPREGAAPLLLTRLMQWVLASAGFSLVDEFEREPALLEGFEPVFNDTERPSADAAAAVLPAVPRLSPLARGELGAFDTAEALQPAAPAAPKPDANASPARVVIRDEARPVSVLGAAVVVPAAIPPGHAPAPPAKVLQAANPLNDTNPAKVVIP